MGSRTLGGDLRQKYMAAGTGKRNRFVIAKSEATWQPRPFQREYVRAL